MVALYYIAYPAVAAQCRSKHRYDEIPDYITATNFSYNAAARAARDRFIGKSYHVIVRELKAYYYFK